MRVVGVEEHFVTEEVLAAGRAMRVADRDLAFRAASEGETGRRLLETGEERIAAMDRTGVDVQVLSLTTPGVQNLPAEQAVRLQRHANDALADVVARRPDRFQGLATLATANPSAAADELERAVVELGLDGAMVFGRTGGRHLDHKDFRPLFQVAADHHAPLHLHPQSPSAPVRAAYYADLDEPVGSGFATFGVGWHYDAGVEVIRMILGGVFDEFPDLQVVVGHWGELVLFYLDRVQQLGRAAGLPRPLMEYVRTNLLIAPSGILSARYLRWAMEIAGADRILFSTDYPFERASQEGAREFLASAELSEPDRARVASGNWDRLRAGILR